MRTTSFISTVSALTSLFLFTACGASQKAADGVAEVDPAVAADAWLAKALEQAKTKNTSVVAVVHADWCGPCNELQLRVFDTPGGREVLASQIVLPVDFEDPVGSVIAARLRVLGLPTTLVLRPDGSSLKEYARIEGFDSAEEYRTQLLTALERKTPAVQGCSNADDRPLDASREVAMLLPDLECSAQQLLSDAGSVAADRLRGFFNDHQWYAKAAAWTVPDRKRLLDVGRSLGRYESRVARKQDQCAQVFASMAQWPAIDAKDVPGMVFWQARCLAKNSQGEQAMSVLNTYLSAEKFSNAAKELVADLLVHEKLEPDRAQTLLSEVTAANPDNHWAFYLLGELATQRGDRVAGRKYLVTANRIKPGVALYMRHLRRLQGDDVPSAAVPQK